MIEQKEAKSRIGFQSINGITTVYSSLAPVVSSSLWFTMNKTVLFIKDVACTRTSLLPIVNYAKFVFSALPGQLAHAASFPSQQMSGPTSCGQNPLSEASLILLISLIFLYLTPNRYV